MFFPYKDDNPLKHGPPWITLSIIGLCAVIYLFFQLPLGRNESRAFVMGYGFIPVLLFGDLTLPIGLAQIPTSFTLITCMFLHGGIMHLLGNMWFLWLYGDNVEEAFGKLRYLVFYLVCGVVGTLAHGFIDPQSQIPLVGASGAISGVMAAYLLIWPKANIRVFYWWIIFFGTINIPAFVVVGFWLFEQFWALPAALGSQGGVAISAHLGGFACGLILTPFLAKNRIRLFNTKNSTAFSGKKLNKRVFKKKGSVPEVSIKKLNSNDR